jgi:3-hydroxybutyryl-CoA dehydrogenase
MNAPDDSSARRDETRKEYTVHTIGVIGSGLMGSGITQVAAQSGLQVRLNDVNADALQGAITRIRKGLERLRDRDRLKGDVDTILTRIHPTTDLQEFAQSEVVIEAISENENLKRSLFAQLDDLCAPHTILASNTSSISITNLAAATCRPECVVGMHFFNPVPAMQLVEVTRGIATSDTTVAKITQLGEQLGKTVVQAADTPGFIVNRILVPMLVEAIYAYQEGAASREDIDQAVRLGLGHPMGPLTLADLIGLDTLLAICDVYYQEFGDPKYRAPILLRRYVTAGWLGRKTGRGFYEYPAR